MVLESALSLSPQQIGPPPTGGSRGYAEATVRVMEALQGGAKAADTGRLARPEGSFGNGGAMRIAPVGLAYRWRPGLTGAWRFIAPNRDCVHEGCGLIRYACTTCMSHGRNGADSSCTDTGCADINDPQRNKRSNLCPDGAPQRLQIKPRVCQAVHALVRARVDLPRLIGSCCSAQAAIVARRACLFEISMMQPGVPVNPDRHTAESSKGCAGGRAERA